ncbi:12109_t:CDS:2, partial [Rhizophagus irregularis]
SEDSSSSSEMKKGHSPITSSQKKKSKTRKSRKVKDAETTGPFGIPPLADPSGIASVPIFKKEKQSSKSPPQDEQSRLEKIIEKIIEKVLNEKFGTITALLHSQNDNSKTLADSEEDEFIDVPMEIDFVRRKDPATDVATVKCRIKRLVIPAGTVDP